MLTANKVKKLADKYKPKKHTKEETIWEEIEADARQGRMEGEVFVKTSIYFRVLNILHSKGFIADAPFKDYKGYKTITWQV